MGSCLFFMEMYAGNMRYRSGQSQQGNNVGEDHQVVKQIGQLPDKVVGSDGAEKNKNKRQNRVNQIRFFPEQVVDIDSTEQIPAEDG